MIGSLYSELDGFLTECLADFEEDWELIPYGSSVNGLMISGHSDLDLSLMIWSNDPNMNEELLIRDVLGQIQDYLRNVGFKNSGR